jgi:hypothetical protein
VTNFAPCFKEITFDETSYLFVGNYFRRHGRVEKFIASDTYHQFVGTFCQYFIKILNTNLNMGTARHPQTYSLA